ncbi:hypothetical protein FNF27_05092 [Cafeteria roenbergensis]|uniref:Uncharacterized protein n=2 Tax=Cafeteria roenbergensis TaxID=33653 RepID=A0A5A8E6W9_CAFRO|nr:hypothetical protein FNF27_05092 [Cafeteria roenbergensis]
MLMSVAVLVFCVSWFAWMFLVPPAKEHVSKPIAHTLSHDERAEVEATIRAQAAAKYEQELAAALDEADRQYQNELDQAAQQLAAADAAAAEAKRAADAASAASTSASSEQMAAALARAASSERAAAALRAKMDRIAAERAASLEAIRQSHGQDALVGIETVVQEALLRRERLRIADAAQATLDDFCASTERVDMDVRNSPALRADALPFDAADADLAAAPMGPQRCVGLGAPSDDVIPTRALLLQDPALVEAIGRQAIRDVNASSLGLQGVSIRPAGFRTQGPSPQQGALSAEAERPCCSRAVIGVHPVLGAFFRVLLPVVRDDTGEPAQVPLCFRRRWWSLPDVEAHTPSAPGIAQMANLSAEAVAAGWARRADAQLAAAEVTGAGSARLAPPALPPVRPPADVRVATKQSEPRHSAPLLILPFRAAASHRLPSIILSAARSAALSAEGFARLVIAVVDATDAPSGMEPAELVDWLSAMALNASIAYEHTLQVTVVTGPTALTGARTVPGAGRVARAAAVGAAFLQNRLPAEAAGSPQARRWLATRPARDLDRAAVAGAPVSRAAAAADDDSDAAADAGLAASPLVGAVLAAVKGEGESDRVVLLDAALARLSPMALDDAAAAAIPGTSAWAPVASMGAPSDDDDQAELVPLVGGWDGFTAEQDPLQKLSDWSEVQLRDSPALQPGFWPDAKLGGDGAPARARRLAEGDAADGAAALRGGRRLDSSEQQQPGGADEGAADDQADGDKKQQQSEGAEEGAAGDQADGDGDDDGAGAGGADAGGELPPEVLDAARGLERLQLEGAAHRHTTIAATVGDLAAAVVLAHDVSVAQRVAAQKAAAAAAAAAAEAAGSAPLSEDEAMAAGALALEQALPAAAEGDECVARRLLVALHDLGVRVRRSAAPALLVQSDPMVACQCSDGPVLDGFAQPHCTRAWMRSEGGDSFDADRFACAVDQLTGATTASSDRAGERRAVLRAPLLLSNTVRDFDPSAGLTIRANVKGQQGGKAGQFALTFPLSGRAWECTSCNKAA